MPASNTKIVTAVAAMHTLGPDYRFKTEVIRRDKVEAGVLQGRLYLKGYGDPTAQPAPTTPRWPKQVKAAGINRVTGSLVVDATVLRRVSATTRTGRSVVRRRLLRGARSPP